MDNIQGDPFGSYFGRRLEKMSAEEFSRLAGYIKDKYGLNLEGRQAMVESRLFNYVFDRGFSSFSDYLNTLYCDDSEDEAANIINRLTTNYTYFLREKEHYEHFTRVFLPEMEKRVNNAELCVWSAGCSFGNEVYTFAACIEDYFENRPDYWDRKLLATDISRNALIAAKKGSYGEASMRSLPPHWRNKYFTEKNGIYTVTDRLRSQVAFKYHNLMEPINFKRKFDLIICRNVMIYFDSETTEQLIERFYEATNPGGYLYIGHAESMPRRCPYKRVQTAIYRKEL